MNIKLHYKLNFCAGVFFNNTVFLNNYEVELDLVTASTNGHEQNVALDRAKYFVEHVCRGAFFVNDNEKLKNFFFKYISENLLNFGDGISISEQ